MPSFLSDNKEGKCKGGGFLSENLINKKQYPVVDIMKFIMALFIIIAHRKPFPDEWEFANFVISKIFGHMCVPFFFITSSFLFFRKTDTSSPDSKNKLWKTEKRLITLYILWSVIYLPCNFVKSFTGHYSEITPGSLIGQCVVWAKDFFLKFSFVHLWYISALIVAILIIFFLLKKFSPKALLIIFSLTTPFALYASEALPLDTYIPNPLLQLFVSSGFCLSLGAFAARCDISFLLKNKWTLFGAGMAALLISGVIRFMYPTHLNYTINHCFIRIVAFLVFIICISAETKPTKAHKTLRNCSTLMYFSHLLIMEEGFRYIAFKTGIDAIATHPSVQFVITLIFSLIFSFIIINLSNTKYFRWLRWFY